MKPKKIRKRFGRKVARIVAGVHRDARRRAPVEVVDRRATRRPGGDARRSRSTHLRDPDTPTAGAAGEGRRRARQRALDRRRPPLARSGDVAAVPRRSGRPALVLPVARRRAGRASPRPAQRRAPRRPCARWSSSPGGGSTSATRSRVARAHPSKHRLVSDWNFAAVWDGIAAIVPERDALVCGDRRITWAEFDDRATRLAWYLEARGRRRTRRPGRHRPHQPPRVPRDVLRRAQARLRPGERQLPLHRDRAALPARQLRRQSRRARPASSPTSVEAAAKRIGERAAAVAASKRASPTSGRSPASPPATEWTPRPPTGDDLIFLYTGGTTGMPKGVMWRNDDLYVALWVSAASAPPDPPDPWAAARAGKRAATLLPAAPLMHGTGLFAALAALAGAGTVVLVDRQGLDAERDLGHRRPRARRRCSPSSATCSRVRCSTRSTPRPTAGISRRCAPSRRRACCSAPTVKRGLLAHLPGVTIVDSLGASEGLGPRNSARADDADIAPGAVLGERPHPGGRRGDRPRRRARHRRGRAWSRWAGASRSATSRTRRRRAATFRVFDGVRYSVPGDYATVDADGTVQLLGRGSACINTGGEKVYPEEVEAELRKHPSVFDCVVVGVPDERFGEKVVALVQVTEGHALDEAELAAWCRARLAGYKSAPPLPARRLVGALGRGQGAPPGAARPGGASCWPSRRPPAELRRRGRAAPTS